GDPRLRGPVWAKYVGPASPRDSPFGSSGCACRCVPWPSMRSLLLLAALAALVIGVESATAASLHRSWCHSSHSCPSDHHTYSWNGLYCTSYDYERLATDTRSVSYDGRKYWCGRKATGTLMGDGRSASGSKCDPSYKGACLDPNASDYDCAGGSGNGPKYPGPVRVVGPDHYGLDADGDGYGCE